jgi:uncharacterized DUF497 family protein
VEIEFDNYQRMMTLAEHGLDMARVNEIFEGDCLTV